MSPLEKQNSIYKVELITPEESEELFNCYKKRYLYTKKANIYGCCVKLLTEMKNIKDNWEENFYAMDENIRYHGRLIVISEKDGKLDVKYDPCTNTAFLKNVNYYGWVKSIALSIAADVLEDNHGIGSVHGAAIDLGGTGVSIISPSKTGKTTHSWGLLRLPKARLISDDWFFVRIFDRGNLAFGSEKNCYIEAEIGEIWGEYLPLVDRSHFDEKGRSLVNVRWIVGEGGVIPMTTIKKIILLKRDKADEKVCALIDPEVGLEYLQANDFCIPHQLVRDNRKLNIRKKFFKNLLQKSEVVMVNTVAPPLDVHNAIVKLIKSWT